MRPQADHMVCLEVRGGNVPADVALDAPGLSMHVLSRPYRAAAGGGDVHYVSSCGTGRITRLMLADVAGHGSAVTDTAAVLHRLMQRYVNHISPRRFVERMNAEFAQLTRSGMFATAIVATYFAPTRRLSLINAGHPPPLLYRAAQQTWELLDPDDPDTSPHNIPLGVMAGVAYESFDIQLEPGDAVVCYTDGLPESRDATGELVGYNRLLTLARALGSSEVLGEWLSGWVASVEAIGPAGAAGAGDDLTVVLIRASGGRPFAGPLACVRGAARFLRSPFRQFPWPEMSWQNVGGPLGGWMSRRRKHARRDGCVSTRHSA